MTSTINPISAANTNEVQTSNAWDGSTTIASHQMPARDLFERAGALFTVEKRELQLPITVSAAYNEDGLPSDEFRPTGTFGVVRTDTQALLGVVSKQYEIVQNDSLLRMAEFIREEVEMDAVTVIQDGGKTAFTAYLRGANRDVVPGDTVKRRIVGYLGHDGKTGCGAMFTTIRVVCSNTLAMATSRASAKVSISHKNGANENFESLITSIDCARETFDQEVEQYRAFAEQSMSVDAFREYLTRVYEPQIKAANRSNDSEEPKGIEDLRVYNKLMRCFTHGMGQQEFAPMSLWSAVNAVTELETSTKYRTAAEAQKQFARASFGPGMTMSNRALAVAGAFV